MDMISQLKARVPARISGVASKWKNILVAPAASIIPNTQLPLHARSHSNALSFFNQIRATDNSAVVNKIKYIYEYSIALVQYRGRSLKEKIVLFY